MPLSQFVTSDQILSFRSSRKDQKALIPAEALERLRLQEVDLVLNFGGNSLVEPARIPAKCGVISYCYGSNKHYRENPIGFHEILHGMETLQSEVHLDSRSSTGTERLASARTKVFGHSYRLTAEAAYRIAPYLLEKALIGLVAGAKEHTLYPGPGDVPTVSTMLLFTGRRIKNTIARLMYGLAFEKKWKVSFSSPDLNFRSLKEETLLLRPRETLKIPRRFTFYADPFPLTNDEIIVEGLSKRTGKGQLLLVRRNEEARVSELTEARQHYSYPQVVDVLGRKMLMPEIASFSAPALFPMEGEERHLTEGQVLKGLENVRLLDTTHVRHGGVDYIFAGYPDSAETALNLYFSLKGITGPYHPHPQNPVVLDTTSARMAGNFIRSGSVLLRVGQNNAGSYGDGIAICRVSKLSPEVYEEKIIGRLKVAGANGPHTLNQLPSGGVVFDHYVDCFSPLAGFRRLLGKYL